MGEHCRSKGVIAPHSVLRLCRIVIVLSMPFPPSFSFKLNESQLSEEPVPITAAFQPASDGRRGTLLIPSNALRGEMKAPPPGQLPLNGSIMVMNSFSRFKAADGKDLISSWAGSMLKMMKRLSVESQQEEACSGRELFGFLVIAYHDPKNFKFYYKAAVPALFPAKPFEVECSLFVLGSIKLGGLDAKSVLGTDWQGKVYAATQHLKEGTVQELSSRLFRSRNECHVRSIPFMVARITGR